MAKRIGKDDNLVDFIDHMKIYANEILQLADAILDKRVYISQNQKEIILEQASLSHGLWDNLEYTLRNKIDGTITIKIDSIQEK